MINFRRFIGTLGGASRDGELGFGVWRLCD